MSNFTILHLSDLHVDSRDGSYSKLLENLLEDIKQEMALSDDIIVVVTGDLVHRGDYRAKQGIINFFKQLKIILNDRMRQILFVPGNHDKMRNTSDEKIISLYEDEAQKAGKDEFYDNGWKYIENSFYGYKELCTEIYREVNGSLTIDSSVDKNLLNTYGVYVQELNGKRICFIRFNTAWSCIGDKDRRNLKIGKFQLDKLKEQYREYSKDRKFDITIALAHHPINWMEGNEEDMFRNELLSVNGFGVNIYMCGHTHERDVFNWYNNVQSLTTLVSGIGWPDDVKNRPYKHNYSSYVINIDLNAIDIYPRSSGDSMEFLPDFTMYTQKRNINESKIVMPICTGKEQGYINLSTVSGRNPKSCYLTPEMLMKFQKYVNVLIQIEDLIRDRIDKIRYDIYNMSYMELDDMGDEVGKMVIENFYLENDPRMRRLAIKKIRSIEYINDVCKIYFTSYLQFICCIFGKQIVSELGMKRVRVHFRKWNKKLDRYEKLCDNEENIFNMEDLKWEQLIKEAYIENRPLIASINEQYCKKSIEQNNAKKDKQKIWFDFITVIPEFKRNIYEILNAKEGSVRRERPILTFGLTIYKNKEDEEDKKDRELLYILDYMNIHKILGRLINKYLYYFPLSMKRWALENGKDGYEK